MLRAAELLRLWERLLWLVDQQLLVSGSGVTVSQNANGITFTISGSVSPDGSGVTVSTGAADVNVITWNPIDPDATQTWTNIDPL